MIRKILTVGGYTLLSRLTGFMRDIMLAAILGAGPVGRCVLRRLPAAEPFPRHLRRGRLQCRLHSGLCARSHPGRRRQRRDRFGDRIFTLLLASQVVLLALALLFTPQVIELLAPGFSREPQQFALAVSLTRITFPYLLLITLVTLWSGILNALHRFAAAAAAPILLNVTMMATLGAVPYSVPGAGHAAAWGVLISGVLQAALVGGDTFYAGVMTLVPRAAAGRATCGASSRRSCRRPSARPARSSRCSPIPSSPAFCRPARSRRCITPTASISCRSA